MAGAVHIGMRLLLLSLIGTGVQGEEDLIFAGRGYDITHPCEEDLVCFHMWQISTSHTSEYIAIVSNGEIHEKKSEEEKCTLQIKDLTAEDVGRHRCKQGKNGYSRHSTHSTAPMINLMPAKTVSLQCVLLTVKQRYCNTKSRQRVSLKWVDEAGAEIQEDSQHRLDQQSSCDITLTVTFQKPGKMKFRCQATVDEQVQTSVEMRVRAQALKGKGRGFIIELEPEHQGGNKDVIGAAVGAVGCVALTVVVAVLVVNRRRTNSQLPGEVCPGQSSAVNVMNTDDVIYADITLPVSPDQMRVYECESTEYACVRWK